MFAPTIVSLLALAALAACSSPTPNRAAADDQPAAAAVAPAKPALDPVLAALPRFAPAADEQAIETYALEVGGPALLFPIDALGHRGDDDVAADVTVATAIDRVKARPDAVRPRYDLACALGRAKDLVGTRAILDEIARVGGARGAAAIARATADKACGLTAAQVPTVTAPPIPAYIAGAQRAIETLATGDSGTFGKLLAPDAAVEIEGKRVTKARGRAIDDFTSDHYLVDADRIKCKDSCCQVLGIGLDAEAYSIYALCMDEQDPTRVKRLDIGSTGYVPHDQADFR